MRVSRKRRNHAAWHGVENAKVGLMKTVNAGVLRIAYLEDGPVDGWPVVLSHGFPYDVHAYDEVVPLLTTEGARVIRPYLRGHGPTRFLFEETPRSGQQAALGSDLVALLDALGIGSAILAGYDWGGNSSCVVSALWPERVTGLVSLASYDIIDIAEQAREHAPTIEHVIWYQHLFQTERGRASMAAHRVDLCRMLWRQWSPNWNFDEATFERSAESFHNPDFVNIVIHAYRHAMGNTAGDPMYELLEQQLSNLPPIVVPAMTLDGTSDTLKPGGTAHHATRFLGRHEHREIDAGHAIPHEAPQAFADAVLTVHRWTVGNHAL
jgi:pimeloyl-ACP methyl ester carboxylesterase